MSDGIFTETDVRSFLLKSKRGEKISRVVAITGNNIFKIESLEFSKIYKLRNFWFEKLLFGLKNTLSSTAFDNSDEDLSENVSSKRRRHDH